jgi:signal transduction histidine kinase/ActR/RegA family two-component response regulator
VSIRSRLILLVLAVLAPTFLGSILAIRFVYHEQLERVERGMQGATRALSIAVDRELARRDAVITALATSPALLDGDLESFYQQASAVAQSLENSLVVYDHQGNQLLNTRRPYGAALPDRKSFEISAPQSNGAALPVSNLYMAPLGGQYSFSVRRPVVRDGKVIYYIAMGSFASQLGRVLAEQDLPADWLGVIVDRNERVVARSADAERFVGHETRSGPHRRSNGDEGFYKSVSLEGIPLLSFYSKAPGSDWTVIIGIPQSEIRRSTLYAAAVVGLGCLIILGIALMLAFWVGRKISTPLRALDECAQAMGRGEPVFPFVTGMSETDRTADVLAQASLRIQNANRELEIKVADAVQQVERSLQALQQGQKLEALGRLTGGIAHDFNNLLQTLTTGLQLADMTMTDPRGKKAIDACNRSVVRGTKLTRQMMAFGRHKVDETVSIDLRELLMGMGELLEGALPSRIRLELDVPEGSWPAYVDALQCELAVLNLVFNARDAMPGSGEIRISLQRTNTGCERYGNSVPEHGYLKLCVSDTGHGMSEAVQAKAFEPFFTTKAVGEGTGLGLAQVYGFAKQSGGCVDLQSKEGKGCRISLLLPAWQATASAGVAEQRPAKLSGQTARLLMVDDDALIREVVVPTLREMGFTLEVADSGDQALQRYRQSLGEDGRSKEFDLVLSDIVMPGSLDGIALAQTIRQLSPTMPILLATGFSERLPQDYGFRVMAKPYAMDALIEALLEELAKFRDEGIK